MKKNVIILLVLILSFGSLYSNESTRKIPQRVFIYLSDFDQDSPLLEMVPKILYSSIQDIELIVPVTSIDEAHTVIEISYIDSRLILDLNTFESENIQQVFALSENGSIFDIEEICSEATIVWNDKFNYVEPDLVIENLNSNEIDVVEDVTFKNRIDTSYHLAINFPILFFNISDAPGPGVKVESWDISFKTNADFYWYPKSNSGLVTSIYLQFDDRYMHYSGRDANFSRILLGAGYSLYLPARIDFRFNILGYVGVQFVDTGTIVNSNSTRKLIEEGFTAYFLTSLSLQLAVGINITEQFSFFARYSLDMHLNLFYHLAGSFPEYIAYDMAGTTLSVGVCYRWGKK